MQKDVRVGLVQINNSFSGQNYLPYSVGVLQAFAEDHLAEISRYEFLMPVYMREDPEKAVDQLQSADIVFFSTYVWNIKISLEIARRLKRAKRDVVIVMGGPQVPDKPESFMYANPFVDLLCHGEGEQTFVDVLEVDLEGARKRQWGSIESTSYLGQDGSPVYSERRTRIKSLDDVPSPYLQGVFAGLMESNPQEKWIALWETNRGCPFSCTFCDWGSAIASKVHRFEYDRLCQELDWFAEHEIEYVFCADANFGILPRDLDIARYAAKVRSETGYPQGLSVQNTKNATDRAYAVQKILSEAGLNKGVTLSLQSVDENTLKEIKRSNISTETYQELQRRFTSDGVETYTDLILGLPGETYESFLNGVSEIVSNGQHNRIQFNNCSILPNAEMGDVVYQKQHGMVIVETEVVNIHGSLNRTSNEILECQELVVGTHSCPPEDWVRARAMAWTCQFYYFNKVLQVPLLLLHEYFSVPFRDLMSVFFDQSLGRYPALQELSTSFRDKATDIQRGGSEYCASAQFLDVWWPADELALIELVHSDKVTALYLEAEEAILSYLRDNNYSVPEQVVRDAVTLNRALLRRPFVVEDATVCTQYNIWQAYQAAKMGRTVSLEESQSTYRVDRTSQTWSSWDDWCREVIWWGNKKGAYLYGSVSTEPQLAGHY